MWSKFNSQSKVLQCDHFSFHTWLICLWNICIEVCRRVISAMNIELLSIEPTEIVETVHVASFRYLLFVVFIYLFTHRSGTFSKTVSRLKLCILLKRFEHNFTPTTTYNWPKFQKTIPNFCKIFVQIQQVFLDYAINFLFIFTPPFIIPFTLSVLLILSRY